MTTQDKTRLIAPLRPDHTPVLASECIEFLGCAKGGVFVDGTSGEGGHTELMLLASPNVRTVSLDLDPEMLSRANSRLQQFGDRAKFVHSNFANIDTALESLNIHMVNGILLDLGISMAHIRSVNRGLAFSSDQPLDMRLNPTEGEPLLELLPKMREEQLAEIIKIYGEEPFSRKVAKAVVNQATHGQLETTKQLADLIEKTLGRHGKTHPATKTFQALRIWINRELENIETVIPKALRLLLPGGSLAIISYHSLEDRIVKNHFKKAEDEGFEIVTKKPVIPSDEEIAVNRAARSAKLRVLRRCNG